MTDVKSKPANQLPIEIFFYDRANNTLRTTADQVEKFGFIPHGINVFSKRKVVLFVLSSDPEHIKRHNNYVFKSKDLNIKTKLVIDL